MSKRWMQEQKRKAEVQGSAVQQNPNVGGKTQMEKGKDKPKGGRLEAKVISVSKSDFTIKVQAAKGHEDSEKEITLPLTAWNGAGAEVGESLGYEPPAQGPKLNNAVLYDSSKV
jgi:hypothetical protein